MNSPHRLSFTTELPVSAHEAFSWHERPGAFERLNPPWEPVTVISQLGGIKDGAEVTLAVPVAGPVSIPWHLRHTDYRPGAQFRDVQARGPFASWSHTHRFEELGAARSALHDEIEFEMPAFAGIHVPGAAIISSKLSRLFAYRHAVTRADLGAHHAAALPSKRILISGASGLVGSALKAFLTTAGHEVVPLIRTPGGDITPSWDPSRGMVDIPRDSRFDIVIHLAGESIASGRWSAARKDRIRSSRIVATHLLAEALATLTTPPELLISASATGFYGDRGDLPLTEQTDAGTGFLAEVAQQWEHATAPAQARGMRVVHARFGVVLSPRGGALQKMLPAFLAGVGGRIGGGNQYMSWIAIDDLLYALLRTIADPSLAGPVNFVAPHPVTNAQFAATLGRVLRRPAIFPVPTALLRLALGELADEALLASQRALPHRLINSGFQFTYPTLEEALRHLLGRTRR